MYTDGYLTVPKGYREITNTSWAYGLVIVKAIRWFKIMSKLPLELQLVLAGSKRSNLSDRQLSWAGKA